MYAFAVEFLRQLDDANRVEWAFLDAYSTSSAEAFVDYGLLLSRNELDRISPVQDFWAESIARNTAIIRFTVFLV